MIEVTPLNDLAGDIIARIMQDMEDVIRLIERPSLSDDASAVAGPQPSGLPAFGSPSSDLPTLDVPRLADAA